VLDWPAAPRGFSETEVPGSKTESVEGRLITEPPPAALGGAGTGFVCLYKGNAVDLKPEGAVDEENRLSGDGEFVLRAGKREERVAFTSTPALKLRRSRRFASTSSSRSFASAEPMTECG
jgi:hypothetical protein